MKRGLTILLLVIPVVLLAGAWTAGSMFLPNGDSAWMLRVVHLISAVSVGFLHFISNMTETAGLLFLGTGLVLTAWLLHRRSSKRDA